MIWTASYKQLHSGFLSCYLPVLMFGCHSSQRQHMSEIHQIMDVRRDTPSPIDSPKAETAILAFGSDEAPITNIFPGHNFQFWLMSAAGKGTNFMTQDIDESYHPVTLSCSSLGEDDEGVEFCDKKPSELAKRCMRSSYEVLEAILADPPREWIAFKAKYGTPEFAGWMNDYEALGARGKSAENASWFGPFNWQSDGNKPGDAKFVPKGPIQWASAIYKDGTCSTPSRDLFLRLLHSLDTCATAPGPHCCGISLAQDPNRCQ